MKQGIITFIVWGIIGFIFDALFKVNYPAFYFVIGSIAGIMSTIVAIRIELTKKGYYGK